MKNTAIIPIFVPHLGCPHDCVFCNQKFITATQSPPDIQDVESKIEEILPQFNRQGISHKELAFFGGSFTAIPIDLQIAYLKIAKKYKNEKQIDRIRLSTRPDCISESVLKHLKEYEVDTIELGAQSFDPGVLIASSRGHTVESIYEASKMIKEHGFNLGIQLMIGLPRDTEEKSIFSALETVKINPDVVRIYPTVIIDDTELMNMYKNGDYTPLSLDDAVQTAAKMCKMLYHADINVIRIGLKSSSVLMSGSDITRKTFHPAFRQLVDSEIAFDKIKSQLDIAVREKNNPQLIKIFANSHDIANVVGHKGANKYKFSRQYPLQSIKYKVDDSLNNWDFNIVVE